MELLVPTTGKKRIADVVTGNAVIRL